MNFKNITDSMMNRLIGFMALYVLFGVVVFHWLEDFGWIDSLYYVIVTLGTIGYGDLAPVTAAGRLFAVFYIIFGLVTFVIFAKIMFVRVMRWRVVRREAKKKK